MKILRGHLLLAVAALLWITGCASIGPPLPPSLELPKPPADLRAARKGNQVKLTWTIPARTTDRESVRYLGKTLVCRSLAATVKQCETPVGEAPPPPDFASARKSAPHKLSATFTDILPAAIEQEHPSGFATYAVEVLNRARRGAGISNQVQVALVPTLSPFNRFGAHTNVQGVLISWECPAASGPGGRSDAKYLFRIYRRAEGKTAEGKTNETRIAQVDAAGCVTGAGDRISSFLDQNIEWENTYDYRAAVVSVVEAEGKAAVEVEGDDAPEVKIFAHDIFPPSVPAGLQAVFSGPGQQAFIDLIWAPVTDADLEGYEVYRHEAGSAAVKLNAEPVRTPAFRDAQVVAGRTYFYSVSAVDQRGNESARSEEASESVP
jgi:hypothetical protein